MYNWLISYTITHHITIHLITQVTRLICATGCTSILYYTYATSTPLTYRFIHPGDKRN